MRPLCIPTHRFSLLALAVLAGPFAGCGDDDEDLGALRAPLTAVCVDAPEAVPDDGWRCDTARVVECDHPDGAQVDFIYVEDPDGPACAESALEVSDDGPYPPGTYEIEVSRLEIDGPVPVCTASLEVVDTAPPEVEPRTLELWPPNHRLEAISAEDCAPAHDACGGPVDVRLLWATSDEPFDDVGDGRTEPDIVELGCDGVRLRAERQGGGDGRVYTLGWRATDARGNSTEGTCRVVVPHDRSGREPVDSGEAERVELPEDCADGKDE